MLRRAGRHAVPESRPVAVVLLTVGTLLTVTGLCGVMLGSSVLAGRTSQVPMVTVPRGHAIAPPGSSLDDVASVPVSLVIPAIGVRARLVRLGSQRKLRVPAGASVAGWYATGPWPGQIGPSVIDGPADSADGPGVFYRLALLRPGDEVYVLRTDGTLAAFVISAVRTYPVTALPVAAVYGAVPYAALRLITAHGPRSEVVAYGYQVGGQSLGHPEADARHGQPDNSTGQDNSPGRDNSAGHRGEQGSGGQGSGGQRNGGQRNGDQGGGG
ncbi:MAG TPA: sortase [Streptosporangiaceae bacterium]|nr:sortase [Streptosporangiaceae bacterium]